LGDVTIETKGKKIKATRGALVPVGSKIITGSSGRASLYDTIGKRTVVINPNSTYKYSGISKSQTNTVSDIFNKTAFGGASKLATVAGVRGFTKKKPCSPKRAYVNKKSKKRSKEWKLYKEKKFKDVLKKVKKAKDDEGVFLRAMSTYSVYGLDKEAEIENDLKNVVDNSKNYGMKTDAQQTMGLMKFDNGDYEKSLGIFNELLNNKKPREMDELSYYLLLKLHQNMGNNEKAQEIWKNAKQYCAKSELVQKVKPTEQAAPPDEGSVWDSKVFPWNWF
jgi:hypothetical protein